MKIQVVIKTVYGNDLCYPFCTKAKLLAKLIGAKTFNLTQISVVKELGYEIELVNAFEL